MQNLISASSTQTNKILWAIVVVFAIVMALIGISPNDTIAYLAPFLSVLAMVAFVAIHGVRRYGAKRMVVFFLLTFAISWTYETISVLTGFPFGNYYYADRLGLKLWLVPLIIMPAYFAVCYLSWTIAHVLLEKLDNRLKGASVVMIPVLASFVMVMWDLSMDPTRSTFEGSWFWQDGGAYFGVPFSNFMGWYLCVYTIFQAFALYVKSQNKRFENDGRPNHERTNWLLPVLMYGGLIFEFLLIPLFFENKLVADPSGHQWYTQDMFQSMALVCFFTMFFVVVLSVFRLYTSPNYRKIN